jgi:HPt (histidine-containing phosphotransfer) domain-containing protein
VAGALAATALQEAAGRLEDALHAGQDDPAPTRIEAVEQALSPLMAALARWLADGVPAPQPPSSGDPQRLRRLLQEFDPEAADLAAALARGRPPEDPLHEVARLAARFEFDEALRRLDS